MCMYSYIWDRKPIVAQTFTSLSWSIPQQNQVPLCAWFLPGFPNSQGKKLYYRSKTLDAKTDIHRLGLFQLLFMEGTWQSGVDMCRKYSTK